MRKVDGDVKVAQSVVVREVTELALYRQRVIYIGKETVRRKRRQFCESRVSSSEAEAISEYKSKDSSKNPRKSKKLKMLRPVNNRLSKALDYNTYRLVGRSALYDDQAANHNTKRASSLQVKMKAHMYLILWTPYR